MVSKRRKMPSSCDCMPCRPSDISLFKDILYGVYVSDHSSGSEPAEPQRNMRRYSENVRMGKGECAIGESMPRRIVKSYQEPRYMGEVGVYGKEAGPDLESARRLEGAATARGPSVAKRATEPVVMEAITTEESAPMMDLPVETETIGVLTTQAVSPEVPPTSLFLDTELPPRGTKSTQAPPPPHLVASSTPATTTNHVIPGSTKLPCQRNNSKPSTCEATSPACHPENGPALRPYETFVGPDETDSEYRDALMGKLGEAIVDAILAKSKKHRHHLAVCSKVDPDSAEMARNALALAMGGCKKAEEQAKKVRQDALARFGQILEALPLSSESKCHRLPPDLKEYLKSLMTGPAEGGEEEEGEKTPPEVVSAPKRELTSWREPVLPYLFSQGPVWVEPPNNVGDWLEDQQYEDHFPDTRLSYPE
ncbi:hypothetical protein AAG570_013870 [Ranatra chinensis]|uniref:Uncharacterized protein n=1 Tax=Ranatra chinensis TaxID=642074 RepID=A0ABD0YVY7_9HEMI